MVNEEGIADYGAGVNVDPGQTMRVFRHHARQQRHALPVEHMCQAVGADGREGRVAEDDLVHAFRRGVALIGGNQVRLQLALDLGQISQQSKDHFLRPVWNRDPRHDPLQQRHGLHDTGLNRRRS